MKSQPRIPSLQFGIHTLLLLHTSTSLSYLLAPSANTGNSNRVSRKVKSAYDVAKVGSLTVPSVGIGTIAWSSDIALEQLELQTLVSTAWAADGAFFDTAERYGGNRKTALGLGWGETERLTRKLLIRAEEVDPGLKRRLSPAVATKFTPTPWRTDAKSVVEACEESRQRLGVEQLDLYQLHMPDIVKPFRKWGFSASRDTTYWDGLAECYHRGLVANVGVCNYGKSLVAECQEALAKRDVPLASNQIAYSLIGRHNGAQETLDKCNELGVTVIASFPFAMGLLTGKYSSGHHGTNIESFQSSLTSVRKTALERKDLALYASGDGNSIPVGGISPLLKVMESIAQRRRKSVAQVALNYIISKGAIPIPGARSTAQMQDNLGAMGWRLNAMDIYMLEREADQLGFGFEGAGFKRTSEKFVGYGVEKWTLD